MAGEEKEMTNLSHKFLHYKSIKWDPKLTNIAEFREIKNEMLACFSLNLCSRLLVLHSNVTNQHAVSVSMAILCLAVCVLDIVCVLGIVCVLDIVNKLTSVEQEHSL